MAQQRQNKVCGVCKLNKPLTEFTKNKSKADGRAYRCKPCHSEWETRKYQINIAHLIEYFTTHPCVDCGESDIVVLDFDHVRGTKYKSISQLRRGSTWETLLKEIEKCEVRCANCHRRQTALRGGWWRLQPTN